MIIYFPKFDLYERLEDLIDPWESIDDLIYEFKQFNVEYVIIQ